MAQWTISAITFIDVTKQYGVHSVGTLYRECMVKVVFHHERFYEIKKIVGGCYNQYCNVNEYICASLRAHGAGFFPVSIAQMESQYYHTKLIVLPSVPRTV